MVLIEIEERIAAALRAQADVRDISLQAFLQRIVETASPFNSPPALPLEDFERSIEELATESPVLPNDFSRADIYTDQD